MNRWIPRIMRQISTGLVGAAPDMSKSYEVGCHWFLVTHAVDSSWFGWLGCFCVGGQGRHGRLSSSRHVGTAWRCLQLEGVVVNLFLGP